MDDFIGRGEREAKEILQKLFPKAAIGIQVPIQRLIRTDDFLTLDQEFLQHKHDIVVYNGSNILVIEINYKHKEKAAKKWTIFSKMLIDNNCLPITIDDYNCELLFCDSKRLRKKNPWGAYIDIIRELQRQGITPDGSLL